MAVTKEELYRLIERMEDPVVSAPLDNIHDVMRDIQRSLDEIDKEPLSSEHPAQKEVR